MKIRRTVDSVCIELPFAEAKVLLDELAHVRGGARLPKLRQVCHELETTFELADAQKRPSKVTPITRRVRVK
jgi:hypothetical protein